MTVADKQRLRLTLIDEVGRREFTHESVEVTADPDDHAALRNHLEQLARSVDHRTGEAWWLAQYSLKVQGLEQEWRKFKLPGAA